MYGILWQTKANNDMSSNIEILKVCEYCNSEFIAKTTVTRFCSHRCASRAYKQRKKSEKVKNAVEQTKTQSININNGLNLLTIKSKEFLSIKEAYTLLGLSERTFYRLMKAGTIQATKLGRRTIIKRTEIDKLFES